jgi:hypothetical protein
MTSLDPTGLASPRYHLFHLRRLDSEGSMDEVKTWAHASSDPKQGGHCIGIFSGVLGLANTDCFVLRSTPVDMTEGAEPPDGFELIRHHVFHATIRPTDSRAFDRPGVYVFRFWSLAGENVDEVVDLSRHAWLSFETDFATEVKALFRQSTPESTETALLITWYQNLTVWEQSRMPSEAAKAHFQTRAALIERALPIATRLVI